MAASKESGSAVIHECFYRCNSRLHGSNLTAVITKNTLSDEKVASYLKWCCIKYPLALDVNGRSLIHVAAAKGRLKLLTFLLGHKDININGKDQESMYTALHRSLFYGQLHCAVRLIELGANLQQLDLDDLTPLDHVIKDRPKILDYNAKNPCEVYVWGTNTNYTLGIGHHQSRSNPEPLDMFRKQSTSVKQVVMNKFHSVFVGSDGRAWSCGHGSGGRLGLDDEITTLVPKMIRIGSHSSSEACLLASTGVDHTVLLMENGSVWTFGLNTYHQLGHLPPPEKVLSPKPIKTLRGVNVIGIAASKFHTAFWTINQLYTCGLHGGQLGHLEGNESTIPAPKIVSKIQLKESTIEHVATSVGATVVITNKGDVYLLHEYQCRKLTSRNKQYETAQVCVVGGHLDHKVNTKFLHEKGGGELKILLLTQSGKLYVWQESTFQLTRCVFSLRRQIHTSSIALNLATLLITTADGEAFIGEFRVRKKKTLSPDSEKTAQKSGFHEFLEKDDCEHIKLKRLPHIYRAVNITSDLKGRNFAVIQAHPKAGLLQIPYVETRDMTQNMKVFFEATDELDSVHDVIFEVGNSQFFAHRYVVSHASSVLEDIISKGAIEHNIILVKIHSIHPQIFRRILSFIYTGDCDLLHAGISPVNIEPPRSVIKDNKIRTEEKVDESKISAYEYNNQKRAGDKKKPGSQIKNDPVKLLKEWSKKFGLVNLHKSLELVKFENGYILNTKEKQFVPENLRFDRKRLQDLWDVSLKSDDGMEIKAHKCILVARSEYFSCMISQGWMESSQKTALRIPISGNVLEILVRYLYTDEAPELLTCEDPDIASLTLVVADQYICAGLKEYSETCLGNLMSLKNAPDMLQLAVTYNATQLKQCAMEFICLNLPALLESRSLEILHDSVLFELKDFYRSWLPCMSRRHVLTEWNAPDEELVDLIHNTEPMSLDEVHEFQTKSNLKTPKRKPKDKKVNETGRTRNVSVGSATSDEEPLSPPEVRNGAQQEETWVKVVNHPTKQQKLVQSRLKATLESMRSLPIEDQPSKLVISSKPITKGEKNISDSEKDSAVTSPSLEKNFPLLTTSLSEHIVNFTPTRHSPTEGSKKFAKLSQKQRRRLATLSISEDEEAAKPTDSVIKSAWGVARNESQSLADIMRQEGKQIGFSQSGNTNTTGAIASSPPWENTSSLTAIMAAERQQRELITRMKSKPLKYTQIEDQAIEDLLLFYNASDITEERITVRRADCVLMSPPVWVSSHR